MTKMYYVSARPEGSHSEWKRVGYVPRTGKFYWFSSSYAKQLRHKNQMVGSVPEDKLKSLDSWAARKKLDLRVSAIKNMRQDFIDMVIAEVGVHEVPLGSNRGPRVDWYRQATSLWKWQKTGWPWCMAFVVRCALESGYPLPPEMRTASVSQFFNSAWKLKLVTDTPRPGDVVELFGFGYHTGVKVGGEDPAETVEGNTSVGNNANGTHVMRRKRRKRDIIRAVDLDRLL